MIHIKKELTHCIEVEPGLFGVKLIDGRDGTRHLALLRGWLNPGASHAPHLHDTEEAVTFLSGSGVVRIDNKNYMVKAGDSVWIPPHVVHSTHNTGKEDLTFIAAFSDSLVSAVSANPKGQNHHLSLLWMNHWSWWFKRIRRWFGLQ